MSTELMIRRYEMLDVFFQPDGWFNATIVAKNFGKVPKDWLKTEQAQELILAVSNGRQIVKVKAGSPQNGGGTWLHSSLQNEFLRWCKQKSKSVAKPQLYIVLFNTGVIKVGTSFNAIRRIKQHSQHAETFGVKILKFFIEKNPKMTEQDLIVYCLEHGTLHNGLEYFKDLNYEAVIKFLKTKVECNLNQIN